MRLTEPFAGSFPEMLNLGLALVFAADAAGAADSAAPCDAGNGGQPACQAGHGAGRQNLGDLQTQQGTAGSASPER